MPFYTHDDLQLYYEVHGEANDKPPLLLLHGLGSSTLDWEDQIPVFSQDRQVIALDFRGFGQSDKPSAGYSVEKLANDAWALLDLLNIEKATILGLSMGAAVTYQMGVDAPERIEQMIIVNGIPHYGLERPRAWFEFGLRWGLIKTMGIEKLATVISKRLFPKPEQQHLRDKLMERSKINKTEVYVAVLKGLAGWSVLKRLGEINTATLVVSGDADFFPMKVKKKCVAMMPNARLEVVADSRHATPMDQVDAFNSLVMDFLR